MFPMATKKLEVKWGPAAPFLPTNPADVCTQMEVVLRKGLLDRRLASNIGRRIVVHVKRQKHPWVGYLLKQTWIWLSYNWYVYIYNIFIYVCMYIYIYIRQIGSSWIHVSWHQKYLHHLGHRWNWGAPATCCTVRRSAAGTRLSRPWCCGDETKNHLILGDFNGF